MEKKEYNKIRFCRPFNSQRFIACHKVSLFFSWTHGKFFISNGFTNFEWTFCQIQNFIRKQTKATHSKEGALEMVLLELLKVL